MNPVLYSETSGRGQPLVLVHGWGMNLRVFDALRAALSQRYRVTALDLAGHGRSHDLPALDFAAQSAQLARQVPPDAIVIGWSLGGQFALQLACEPSLAISRLVLMASTPRFVAGSDWPHGLPALTLQRFGAQLQEDVAGTISDFLELQVRGSADAAQVLATLKQALGGQGIASTQALQADLSLLERNDLRALAAQLSVPTLVITGQYDRVTPPAAGEALARLLPHAQLQCIARAGHAPFLSHPDQVLAALHEFLRSGDAAATAASA